MNWEAEQFETNTLSSESSQIEETANDQKESDILRFLSKKYEFLKTHWLSSSDDIKPVEMKEIIPRKRGKPEDEEEGGTIYVLTDTLQHDAESGEEEETDMEEMEEDGVYIGLLDGNVKKTG